MIDKLPIEIISTDLVNFCDRSSIHSLTLTCKTLHNATLQRLNKFRVSPNLINFDNPIFHDEDRALNRERQDSILRYKNVFFTAGNSRYGQSLKIRNNYRDLVRNLKTRPEVAKVVA
ncbi:hypothetical protein BN7_1024 [Wickerhamomyces ciferrii]|uniref:F-box domain-containing protein n=1 Tax=Wickerhamomyces ciferrii (strain ATCC 14091 / BCRC 22168 / CBS 111 / JCM 3599 / NBRC 0793 / NRRL Y-1031 F-60-10) TaxID=1206466 RepID=K0KK20_WICCF|nr:uncharacterized protein BN7_1024 [Wickerhamomyces ciferrii]CCH41483.1 hypothetical protein BN7_1024 [Wickerhamomyces ciferrii]